MKTRRLFSESAYIAGVIGAGNSTKINNLFEMLSFVSVADKDGTLNLTEKNSLKELILAGNIDAAKTLISTLQSKGEEWSGYAPLVRSRMRQPGLSVLPVLGSAMVLVIQQC